MSRHLTKRAAMSHAAELNARQRTYGKSSGWARIDYAVRRRDKGILRWEVHERASRS